MSSRLLKIIILLSVTSLVAGCKLAVMVPSGGDVTSLTGTRDCPGGNEAGLCEFNITDTTFDESFTAVARAGYVFTKWHSGPGFQCANSTNPTCTISNTGIPPGNVYIDTVIAGGSYFYAMPLFEYVGIDTDGDGIKDHWDEDDDNDGVIDELDGCPLVGPNIDGSGCPGTPITDTVNDNGRVWAQPDLFTNLSWNEVKAACPLPEGICDGEVTLNGYSLKGWTWASRDDVLALFESYYTSCPNHTGGGLCEEVNSAWAPAFFSKWRPTSENEFNRQVYGDTRSLSEDESHSYTPYLREGFGVGEGDVVSYGAFSLFDNKSPYAGSYFYQN